MGTITDLHMYLANAYPSLQLRAGLVWRWPGVRFELWPSWRPDGLPMFDPAFRSELLGRAWSIFRAVNAPDDDLFLVADTWRRTDGPMGRRTGLAVLGRYLKHRRLLVRAGYEEFPYLYADDPEEAAEARTCRFCVRCRVSDVRVRPLLTAIANQDFPPLKPRVHDDCYFVNATRNTILHMYDDRGVDVIAADRAFWQGVAAQFSDWVSPDCHGLHA
jgi:hypothetical protein